ncbi:TRAP transporter permease [Amorphus sp. 3PC139-8]|uniref:TRAP transporter permease n=1 Tax=Amorphus sp. 3PC139-8 TaxID=2735676 RepID=UPI00345D109B
MDSEDLKPADIPLAADINPRLCGVPFWAVLALGAAAFLLTVNQVFRLQVFGFMPVGNAFLYYLVGLYLAATFLILPARKADARHVPFYDWLLALVALGSGTWLGVHGLDIIRLGWDYEAPLQATMISSAMLVVVLEGVRRSAGAALLCVALIFGAYPLFAGVMPGFLWGTAYSFGETIRAHVMGVESIIGIPMQVVANLIIGFVLFGSTLIVTGGARFFMDLAVALLGSTRGGPAKVAVLSSGLMGSLSGSVVTNILTTGPITVGMMKRSGYPKHYAAAVEACASTGGTLMPPVMGAVAFIMASFLSVSYATIAVAAFFPAFLFYVALLLQVDTYAASKGLEGLPREELPKLRNTLKSGWPYLLSLVLLVYMLLVLRLETYAPYYASALLIAVALLKKGKDRFNLRRAGELLMELTVSTAKLVSMLAGIGLVVGGLTYSGVAGAFARELLLYAGNSVPMLLLAGAVASFVLGMGMTVSACYIFLSILLAPALVGSGLNKVGSHLFILYWGMLSYITPPVALASITAANLAGANAWRSGLASMRLGAVLFVLPFVFVLNPALILEGNWPQVALSVTTAMMAVWLLASVSEGYLYSCGPIDRWARALLAIAALALIYPGLASDAAGTALVVLVYGWLRFFRRPFATP